MDAGAARFQVHAAVPPCIHTWCVIILILQRILLQPWVFKKSALRRVWLWGIRGLLASSSMLYPRASTAAVLPFSCSTASSSKPCVDIPMMYTLPLIGDAHGTVGKPLVKYNFQKCSVPSASSPPASSCHQSQPGMIHHCVRHWNASSS